MAVLMLSTVSVNAAVTELNIEKDLSNNKIEISGKALPNERIGFQILPEDISLADFAQSESKNDIIAFVREAKADEKGNFEINAVLEDSGNYKLYVASSDKVVAPTPKNVEFYSSDIYEEKIILLNNAKDESGETGFVNTAKDVENIAVLGFNESINDIVPVEDTLKFMYKELGRNDLDADEYLENIYLYRNSFVVLALNRDVLDDIDVYVKNIINEDETLKKYWEQYVTSDEIESYLINKISRKSISDIDDLKLKLKEGLILAATKYPNGYMSLKELYSDYRNVIGLNKISSKNSVYKAVGGNDYDEMPDLKKAYEKAAESGEGGGGSNGGGFNVGNGNSFSGDIVDSGSNNVTYPQAITLKFLDLSAFEWAYPSISTLYDQGIISGVSENQFAPARQVKREEFVTMIVNAMKLELKTGSNFADVDNGAWYASYVYAAYDNNIVNGISADKFGVSGNITRQDMAVMIYNAIKLNGYEKVAAEVSFDDKENIAGYAREAVEQLVSLGIINGTGDNKFAPTADATRAEAAVIIERALQYLK